MLNALLVMVAHLGALKSLSYSYRDYPVDTHLIAGQIGALFRRFRGMNDLDLVSTTSFASGGLNSWGESLIILVS